MTYQIDSIYSLKNASSRDLTLFIGSGISVPSPTSLPTAYEFIESVLKLDWVDGDEKFPVSEELIKESNLKNIRFEHLLSVFHEWGKFKIGDLLSQFSSAIPNQYHSQIAELCKKEIVQNIITTNFDTCLEKALKMESIPFNVMVSPNHQFINDQNTINIFKIHGSIQKEKEGYNGDSLIATLESLSHGLPDWKRKLLMQFIENNTTIFIGYSGSDSYDINPVLFKANKKYFFWVAHQAGRYQPVLSSEVKKILDGSMYPKAFFTDTGVFLGSEPVAWRTEKFVLNKSYRLENLFHPSVFIGRVFEAVHDYRAALEYYEEVNLGSTLSNYWMFDMLDINRSIAVCNYELGNYNAAEMKLIEVKANLNNYVSRVLADGRTPEEFIRSIFFDHMLLIEEEQALVAARLDDREGAAKHLEMAFVCLENIGGSLQRKAAIRQRLMFNMTAINSMIQPEPKPDSKLHKTAQTIKTLEKVITQKEQQGDYPGLIMVLERIGFHLLLLGKRRKAKEFFFRVFQEIQKLKSPPREELLTIPAIVISYILITEMPSGKLKGFSLYLGLKSAVKDQLEEHVKKILIDNTFPNWQDAASYFSEDEVFTRLGQSLLADLDQISESDIGLDQEIDEDASDESLLSLALKLFHSGHHNKSIAIYEKLIVQNPFNIEAYIDYSNLLSAHNDFESAMDIIDNALKFEPQNYKLLANKGFLHNEMGDYLLAIPVIKEALKLNDSDEISWNNLGNSFFELGLLKEALDSYNRAIEIRPGFLEAINNRKNVLIMDSKI